MRLIDADELMVAVEKDFEGVCVYDVPPSEAVSDFERIVDSVPTIDAEPVRHGRWIEVDRITWRGTDDNLINITVEEKCSNCGRHVERYETVEQENYCPSCGAKMDLKEE